MGMDLYNALLAAKLADGGDFSPSASQLSAMNSGITSNILDYVIKTGSKNLIPYQGTTSKDAISYVWNSDGTIKISGTKGTGVNCIDSGNIPLHYLGLKAGDKIVGTNNSANGYISVFFWNGTSYAPAWTVNNETKETTVPNDCTEILFRVGVTASVTAIDETITPMVCNKILWDLSHDIVPNGLSNAALTAAIKSLDVRVTALED